MFSFSFLQGKTIFDFDSVSLTSSGLYSTVLKHPMGGFVRANLGEKRQVLSTAQDIPSAAYHKAVNYNLVSGNRIDALF